MKNRKRFVVCVLAALAVIAALVFRFRPVGFDELLPVPHDEVAYCYAILVPSFGHDPILHVDIPVDSPEYQSLIEQLDSTTYIWSGLASNSHRITLENYTAFLYFRQEKNLFNMNFYGPDIVIDDYASWKDSIYLPTGGKNFQQQIVDYLVACHAKFQSDS